VTFENLSAGSGAAVKVGAVVVPERAAYVIEGRGGSPSLRIEFEMRDGTPACVSVAVVAATDGRRVENGDLATLPPLNRLAVEVFSELAGGTMSASDAASLPPLDAEHLGERIHAKLDAQLGTKARATATTDLRDAELLEVARVYRDNLHDSPLKAVEELLGKPRRTASRLVLQARDRGYLPKTTQGRKNA
jgi:hypothetical protein